MIVLALLALGEIQAENPYRWHTAVPGEIVQYGVPGTDDRALRIDCRAGRGLQILGPSAEQSGENMPTPVTFRRGTNSVRLLGVTVEMGDGLNFAVPVAADELPIATLLAGEPLTVSHGEQIWQVPGEGAAAELALLVASCPVDPR